MKNIKIKVNEFKNSVKEKINNNHEGQPSRIKEALNRAKLRSRQNTALRVYHERRQGAETARLTAKRAYEDLCRLAGQQIDINSIFDICDIAEVAEFVDRIDNLPTSKKISAVAKINTILVCTAQAEVLDEDAEIWEGYLSKLGVQREEPLIDIA